MFNKKHCLNFNAIINQKPTHVGECTHQLSRGSPLYKPKTKNVSQKALLELQRYKQSKANPRWWMKSKIERAVSWITSGSELCNSVSQFLQNCSTPFSSSQSGKANDESAAPGGKNKKCFTKSIA